MPWNSISPNGGVSVKANETIGQQNTTYTETTLNNDHYWNIGSNEDGRHKYVNMPVQGSDPSISTGMSGILYLKSDGSRVQGFYRNVNGIYEFIPAFLSGTHVITGSFTNMVAVPASVYGEIYIFQTADGSTRGQAGFFKSNATVCDAWPYAQQVQSISSSTPKFNVIFGNGSNASGLNIRVRVEEAAAGATWNYRITYRAI
jgi:hypothetical protein